MARSTPERRRKTRVKAGFSVYYAIFLIFVYGPMFAMFTLSFQGPRGGVTFPMRGLSFFWWEKLAGPSAVGDIKSSLVRSLILAVIVMVITAIFSTMLAMAFRKKFRGSGVLFYAVMAGLMVPGVLLSLGLASLLRQVGIPPAWWYSGLGVHVVWTLPFGFLVMMAVFNRFDAPARGSGARHGRRRMDGVQGNHAAADHAGHRRGRPVRLHAVLRRVRPHHAACRARQTRCRSTSMRR